MSHQEDECIFKRYKITHDGLAVPCKDGDYILVRDVKERQRELHKCEDPHTLSVCCETPDGKLKYSSNEICMPKGVFAREVKFCPFCGFKAGEK